MMLALSYLLSMIVVLIFGVSLIASWLEDRFWSTRLQLVGLDAIPIQWTLWLTVGAATAETTVLALYFMPLHNWWRAALASGLLLLFIVYLLMKRKNNKKSSCSCIGQVGFLNRYPITRNLSLMVIIIAEAILPGPSFQRGVYIPYVCITIAILLLFALRFVMPQLKKDRLKLQQIREAAGAAYANAAYMELDYSSAGFNEINEWLTQPGLPPMIIELHAPSWYVENKRKIWPQHHAYAIPNGTQKQTSGPMLLWTTERGKLRKTTEAEAFLKLCILRGERDLHVQFKGSSIDS
ncbi:MauE/DoxX family redox-associated membrane protein [Paenibacillus sp. MMS18-CY102]|uniref:MauE/DoxX family redox-associated membrane protein n=1 Tax=Paenibacillus sp. MMS18-CY102 TaxID=2682849 RepID=UPI001365BE03|nr:MauE/DoxX family redox-associated membrane protein [Paenibacillus sp. MMS18-CY102]MWC31299.1 hypothetical protein [Paenibacillus sp. MMS18-CY102]